MHMRYERERIDWMSNIVVTLWQPTLPYGVVLLISCTHSIHRVLYNHTMSVGVFHKMGDIPH